MTDDLRNTMAALIESLAEDAKRSIAEAEAMVSEAMVRRESAILRLEYAEELARLVAERLK